MKKVKFMTLAQIIKIRENNYLGDPSTGYGFDYGADLKDEIDRRYYELLEKKEQEKLTKILDELDKNC